MGLKEGAGLKAQKAEPDLKHDGPSFFISETQPIVDIGQARLEPHKEVGLQIHNPMGLKEKIGAESRVVGCESELANETGSPVPLLLTRMASPTPGAQRQGNFLPSVPPVETQNGEESCKLRSVVSEVEITRMASSNPGAQRQENFLPSAPPVETQNGEVSCILRSVVSEDENDADAESEHGLESLMAQEGLVTAVTIAETPVSTPGKLSLVCKEGVEGESSFSPLTCTPIMMVGPAMSPSRLELLGGGVDALDKPTQWVAHQMNMFRKLVGVSIKGHETECLALLRKIEADRNPKKTTTSVRKTARKGNRELRNLVSSVNYGGKQLSCC